MLFEITLRRLALVATASYFWKKNDVQIMLKQYFYPHARRGKETVLRKLIKNVMKKVDLKSFPSVLHSEVLLAIKELGLKMINWFYYVRRLKVFRNIPRKELYEKFLKNVCFTYYGTIDEVRILKSWMNIPNVDVVVLYVMACYFCSEELIDELWRRIVAENHSFYGYEHLCRREGFHLVAYWQKVREDDVGKFFNDVIQLTVGNFREIYDPSQSVEVNMFRLSVTKGYVRAVKYFGSKMSKVEMENNLEFCLPFALDLYQKKSNQDYRKEQYTEISLYLANFLTYEKKTIIFRELEMESRSESYIKPFFKMFISMWPWQEYFKFVFNLLVDIYNEEDYDSFMDMIIMTSSNNGNDFGVPIENSIFQKQLLQVWYSIPSSWKASIGKKLSCVLYHCDLTSMQKILNDSEMLSVRNEIIKKFYSELLYLHVEHDFEKFLLEFMEKIAISPKWSENVRKTIISLYNNITSGNLDSMNDLLEFATEEETQNFKELVHHELICYYFMAKNEFESADKFLKWKFDKKEDIVKYKKTFYENAFTRKYIIGLWRSSLPSENIQIISNKFLCWFLETEYEIISFKIEHFAEREFRKSSRLWYWMFVKNGCYEKLEGFLYWCGFNQDVFVIVKNDLIQHFLKYVVEDCMKRNARDEADKLFKWAFDAEPEKVQHFMRKFLFESEKKRYIFSCKLYICKYWHIDIFSPEPTRDEVTENFKKFINFFLKPYLENLDELKQVLRDWLESSNEIIEKISEDDPSSVEDDSEFAGDFDDPKYIMYCKKENCELFLTLLDEIETGE